jgi:hypothetical protein
MSRSVKVALSLLLLLATSSCSVIHIVLAVVRDGNVHLVARDEKVARSPICLYDLQLIDENRTMMWSIATPRTEAGAAACVTQSFPIAYGRAPSGTDTLVAAKPLEDGKLYVIRAWMQSERKLGPSWGGAFRYSADPPAARNIEYGSREHARLMKRLNPGAR